ncbi:peptidoglycan editing factor PgeF [Pusillimonas sp.]|uniref:peptidoglycan editing factor PgeF n=1 Tax=Pusillimonas sp. TaxID=3040095 RepID=UPI0029BC3868|nr:peptidoglycan editing factor PgeF [Pusillimonas sp.]MDX3894295.1 peptidoglycan editing factor PgeF [Pusillimonas sp.]
MGIVTRRGMPVATGSDWPGVCYFTTLRLSAAAVDASGTSQAGVSAAPYDTFNLGEHVGDDEQAVRSNRERLAALLPQPPIWLRQVHGIQVFDADSDACCGDGLPPEADAAVTSTPGRVLCIMTADCLPIVLSDLDGSVLGVAHAGWRGLAGGVLENTLAALRERAPAGAQWRAWIGPAIGQAAFEVGEEVRSAFVEHDLKSAGRHRADGGPGGVEAFFAPGRPGKWHADLAGLAVHRLKRAGVHEVLASGLCTHARSDLFYSYRRDGRTGRMATLAWLAMGRSA